MVEGEGSINLIKYNNAVTAKMKNRRVNVISVEDDKFLLQFVIKVLERDVNDEGQWIDYYLWEIDFGKDAKRYQVTVDGKSFVLSTPGKLYDFIINLK